jgi:hypothetical protein
MRGKQRVAGLERAVALERREAVASWADRRAGFTETVNVDVD